jgi:CheY-like chemotaxis protein
MPKFFNQNCAVVYVDDSADDHFLLQLSVRRTQTPLHIQPFFSAEPAIAYLKGEPPFEDRRVYPFPAFLLCDYDLKISLGPDLVKALRAITSCASLPIIMFSGSDDKGSVLRSYLAGANHYLCKPATPARMDILVPSLYGCAVLETPNFQSLSNLQEYQPHPRSARPAASGSRSEIASSDSPIETRPSR